MKLIRTIAICYLALGLLLALAFHWIFYAGPGPPPEFDLDYLGQLLGIVAFWPLFAVFVFIIIAASAG